MSTEDIQPENGWMRIAHDLSEAFAKINIPSRVMQVLWLILRDTYGWEENRETISCKTTNERFQELTGLSRQSVWNKLSWLEKKGIIKIDYKGAKYGTGVSKNRTIYFLKSGIEAYAQTCRLPHQNVSSINGDAPSGVSSVFVNVSSLSGNGNNPNSLRDPKETLKETNIKKERNRLFPFKDSSYLKRRDSRLEPSDFGETED